MQNHQIHPVQRSVRQGKNTDEPTPGHAAAHMQVRIMRTAYPGQLSSYPNPLLSILGGNQGRDASAVMAYLSPGHFLKRDRRNCGAISGNFCPQWGGCSPPVPPPALGVPRITATWKKLIRSLSPVPNIFNEMSSLINFCEGGLPQHPPKAPEEKLWSFCLV